MKAACDHPACNKSATVYLRLGCTCANCGLIRNHGLPENVFCQEHADLIQPIHLNVPEVMGPLVSNMLSQGHLPDLSTLQVTFGQFGDEMWQAHFNAIFPMKGGGRA